MSDWETFIWWDSAGRVEAELNDGSLVTGELRIEAAVDKNLEEYPIGYIVLDNGVHAELPDIYDRESDVVKWRKI